MQQVDSGVSAERATFNDLGDRMKGYERDLRFTVPANSLALVRLDGRSFSSWTRGLDRPYDLRMIDAMGSVTQRLCEEISGAQLGYTQSDEITLLLSDMARPETQHFFGGQVQKICSVAASLASAHFSRTFADRPVAVFDARVFVVPSGPEAVSAILWRQLDCQKNATSMLASHHFSAKQLHGVSTRDRARMLVDHGVDLAAVDRRFANGQLIYRDATTGRVEYVDKRTGETKISPEVTRRVWRTVAAPDFADLDLPFTPQDDVIEAAVRGWADRHHNTD